MNKYILHLYQSDGCDYTIGCGHVIIEFESELSGIMNKAKEIVEDYSRDDIDKITLYQISHKESIDINDLFREDDAEEERRGREEKELQEKKLLEELKKKYPNS